MGEGANSNNNNCNQEDPEGISPQIENYKNSPEDDSELKKLLSMACGNSPESPGEKKGNKEDKRTSPAPSPTTSGKFTNTRSTNCCSSGPNITT